MRQWESFNDQYTYDLDSNQVQKATELGSEQTPDETVTSTYDANVRLLRQVDTTSSGSTTTDYSYNNTDQTEQTVYSGTPSGLGQIQSSQQYQYDLQDRMTVATVTTYTNGEASQIEQLTYGYDDNGIRVSALDKIDTSADGTWSSQTLTQYLNDPDNFTGYSQVLRETQTDAVSGQIQSVTEYAIGLRQVTQTTTVYTNGHPGTPSTTYFGFDGHGSVRVLFDAGRAIATIAGVRQLFNYDAYGNPIGFNIKAAATHLLYSGQRTDVATNLQYLRARYYSPTTGTFTTLDPFIGNQNRPVSYNKYLYTNGDPVNLTDPAGRSGDFSLTGLIVASGISGALFATATATYGYFKNWTTQEIATYSFYAFLAGAAVGAGAYAMAWAFAASLLVMGVPVAEATAVAWTAVAIILTPPSFGLAIVQFKDAMEHGDDVDKVFAAVNLALAGGDFFLVRFSAFKVSVPVPPKFTRVGRVGQGIVDFLGKDFKIVRSDEGGFVAISAGNTKRFRIDFQQPGTDPHAHLEIKNINGNWVDAPGTPHRTFFGGE